MRKDIKILPGPTTNSGIPAGKIPLLTGDKLGTKAHESWLKKSKLMDVQNIHRIEQDLRKAIQLLLYYSGTHPYASCSVGDKLLTMVQLVDLDSAYRSEQPRLTMTPLSSPDCTSCTVLLTLGLNRLWAIPTSQIKFLRGGFRP